MKTKSLQDNKSIKAEITVKFKTCDLMSYDEFNNKYHGNIEEAILDLIKSYSLYDIIDDKYIISNVKIV